MTPGFSFESADIAFELADIPTHTLWLERVIAMHHRYPGAITFIFCSDNYLAEMNQQYLDHDTFTDVITFDYSSGAVISGDIFISIDRIKDNAVQFNNAFEKELQLVMVHGVLHLLGFEDKEKASEKAMRDAEVAALNLLEHL
ncbi:MAG: hypothetical protein ABR95_03180 [Sphingobacteriales bacterium BACL12 MAG-120813-bin55]|jgi:probable rRNA maturation factor|nr:MAG: hypothetical protein ABR94_09850 [Sphingobacteriales bacterium BACL12 MAG-120802-bin5]KRP10619.1 MAG: hypothetical protein ABR95_03180 [Sphingobacteriales bacterium BACL12 MAG-120813-bin55]